MIIVVVAILVVAAVAIWATTRCPSPEKGAGTSSSTTSGSATVGDKDDADVNLKVNLPDSVTIDAHWTLWTSLARGSERLHTSTRSMPFRRCESDLLAEVACAPISRPRGRTSAGLSASAHRWGRPGAEEV
jgi:hypothetical protein